MGELRFEEPDLERFPCLRLAREAGEAGGSAPIVLNAANEVVDGAIRYADIADIIAATLAATATVPIADLATALAVDAAARAEARRRVPGAGKSRAAGGAQSEETK